MSNSGSGGVNQSELAVHSNGVGYNLVLLVGTAAMGNFLLSAQPALERRDQRFWNLAQPLAGLYPSKLGKALG